MAPRPDLSRSLRRAGTRPAGPRTKAPNPRLVAAFEAGLYPRGSFKPGTAGAKAANAVLYRRSQANRKPWETAREAARHDRPEVRAERTISVLLARPDPFVVLQAPSRREASRAARYDAYVGQLAEGRITARAFERKISGWRPIRGERFLSNPDAVLAVLENRRAADQETFVYRSGRAT